MDGWVEGGWGYAKITNDTQALLCAHGPPANMEKAWSSCTQVSLQLEEELVGWLFHCIASSGGGDGCMELARVVLCVHHSGLLI